MLGGNCSPCCGCKPATIEAFYNKVAAADVTIALTGQTTERNTFTLTLYPYIGPGVDLSILPAWVFQQTISPVGTWAMALIPEETFLSEGFAQISFGMTAQETLHASLTITIQPRSGGSVYGNSAWPGLSDVGSFGSACKVSTTLSVWQDVVTRKYLASDILGSPQQKSGTGMSGASCSLRFFSPQMIREDVYWDLSSNPIVVPAIWQQDMAAGSQASPLLVSSISRPRYAQSETDQWVPATGTTGVGQSLTLSGQANGGGFSNSLVRLQQTTDPNMTWRTGPSEPQLDLADYGYVRPNCPWRTTSQATSGNYLLTSATLIGQYPVFTLSQPNGIDAAILSTPGGVDSVLTPSVFFTFE
jgi:hypothetical protein